MYLGMVYMYLLMCTKLAFREARLLPMHMIDYGTKGFPLGTF